MFASYDCLENADEAIRISKSLNASLAN